MAAASLAVPLLADADPWPTLRLDPTQTTLSGLSSGGYMAVQLHVAYSGTFARGVGVVAGGPFHCAEGQLRHATGRCLDDGTGAPVEALQATARRYEQQGAIDPLANLRASRVYVFTGANDLVLKQPLGHDLARWYAAFVPAAQIRTRFDVPAEHGMVTDDFGNACAVRGGAFIQNCGVDLAGEMLAWLLAPAASSAPATLAPRAEGALQGRWLAPSQREFIAAGRGMGEAARLYVPRVCEGGREGGREGGSEASGAAPCRLHVVLHGCGQSLDNIGETYVRHTGYPRWAETNRLVLLFPQTSREALNSCWDWWGYTGADYAQRSGAQMAAIKGMVDRLTGAATAGCVRAFNATHVLAGRAIGWFGQVLARGSGVALGWPWQRTALATPTAGHHVRGAC
jgi:poly(3-hydroxybutyrate) depolymerase